MAEVPEASLLVLKKTKRFAPSFHEHIVSSQVKGNAVKAGDRMLVYVVDKTEPSGTVMVTERTAIEFK